MGDALQTLYLFVTEAWYKEPYTTLYRVNVKGFHLPHYQKHLFIHMTSVSFTCV